MQERPNQSAASLSFEFAALELATNYRRALLEEFGDALRGCVVEVGAGVGQLTQNLRHVSGITRLIAIEPCEPLVEQFRARLPDVTLVQGTIDSLKSQQVVDAVVSVNVLEHIADDADELEKYAGLLRRSGGILCLFVPARMELYAPIDRDFGHYRRYAKGELRRKLCAAGFAPLRIDYFNALGYLAWALNFRLLKRREFDERAVRLFDSVLFPLVHAFETRIARPWLGQSLIALARPCPSA